MTKSYDFRNGYNQALEDILKDIDAKMKESYHCSVSIHTVLLSLKAAVLRLAYLPEQKNE
jgi:hypothetical protein